MLDLKNDLVPVLLGADLNCYSVARAFYEEYGVISHAFGKYSIGATSHSKIVRFYPVSNLDNIEICVKALRDFAESREDKILILIGCTDEYSEFIIDNKARLEDKYIIPYIDSELKSHLVDKASFYELCDKYEIPYPRTCVVSSAEKKDALTEEKLGFSYPIVVKPSSSIEYWRHPFENMKKVYFSASAEETEEILSKIYESGYDRRVILQDTIPGGDSDMRVLTVYSDRNAEPKMLCLGHVLLEEHTPKGRGNHAAIITEKALPICEKIKEMLKELKYVGFSNFDIKYDRRDGVFKVFEINLRQGRSNHYVTASGINIAKLLVDDRVLNEELHYIEQDKEFFWHCVPKKIVYTYTEDEEAVKLCKRLSKEKKEGRPFFFSYDLKLNPMRTAFVFENMRRQFKKYSMYCEKMR